MRLAKRTGGLHGYPAETTLINILRGSEAWFSDALLLLSFCLNDWAQFKLLICDSHHALNKPCRSGKLFMPDINSNFIKLHPPWWFTFIPPSSRSSD